MRIANVSGRACVVLDGPDGWSGVDIATTSGGRFGPGPSAVLAQWPAFVQWTRTASFANGVTIDRAALGPVSPNPAQVFAVGLNYRAHIAETGRETPKAPAIFTKFPTCLTGPYADVHAQNTMDWEVELVVVIGTEARNIVASDAWSVVAGVTVGQDYSERTVQNASGGHFSMGKSYPGFGPTGPWLVTLDELANPDDLALSTIVNGVEMQSSRTSMMIYSVPALIEHLSAITPLLPGDIIFTGTPEGVGARRTPPHFLAAGDVVESTIESVGTIRNRIV